MQTEPFSLRTERQEEADYTGACAKLREEGWVEVQSFTSINATSYGWVDTDPTRGSLFEAGPNAKHWMYTYQRGGIPGELTYYKDYVYTPNKPLVKGIMKLHAGVLIPVSEYRSS